MSQFSAVAYADHNFIAQAVCIASHGFLLDIKYAFYSSICSRICPVFQRRDKQRRLLPQIRGRMSLPPLFSAAKSPSAFRSRNATEGCIQRFSITFVVCGMIFHRPFKSLLRSTGNFYKENKSPLVRGGQHC